MYQRLSTLRPGTLIWTQGSSSRRESDFRLHMQWDATSLFVLGIEPLPFPLNWRSSLDHQGASGSDSTHPSNPIPWTILPQTSIAEHPLFEGQCNDWVLFFVQHPLVNAHSKETHSSFSRQLWERQNGSWIPN